MSENSEISARIIQKRREKGLTLNEVAMKVGVAASTIQRYENGSIKNFKAPVLNAIAAALGVTPEWLCGKSQADRSYPMPRNVYPADLGDYARVPVIGRVAAGLACHAEENIEYFEYASKDLIRSGSDYVYLKVVGDSMSPLIMEGDLVLVRCQEIVESGEYAVVLIDNEDGVVKKVNFGRNYIELISINPYYPPRRFEGNEMERIRIFGKVIESKRKF